MNNLSHLGRLLVVVGLAIAGMGLLLTLGGKLPWFGRLPGDIVIQRKNFTFYFPVVTCIVISILLSFLLNIFFRR